MVPGNWWHLAARIYRSPREGSGGVSPPAESRQFGAPADGLRAAGSDCIASAVAAMALVLPRRDAAATVVVAGERSLSF